MVLGYLPWTGVTLGNIYSAGQFCAPSQSQLRLILLSELLMVRSKSGPLTSVPVWQPIPKPTKRFGVSNGFQRRGEMKDSRLLEQIEAFLSTGKQQEDEILESVLFDPPDYGRAFELAIGRRSAVQCQHYACHVNARLSLCR